MTLFRFVLVALLAGLPASMASAAPAPLAKAPRRASGATIEQLEAELRSRGYDLYTLKMVANDKWEVTIDLYITDGGTEAKVALTHRVEAANRRAALLALLGEQQRTVRTAQ